MSSRAAFWFLCMQSPSYTLVSRHSRANDRLVTRPTRAAPTCILLCARSSSCSRHAGTCLMSVTPCPASHVAMGDVRLPSKMQYGVSVPMAAADLLRRVSCEHASSQLAQETVARGNPHRGLVSLLDVSMQGEGEGEGGRFVRR